MNPKRNLLALFIILTATFIAYANSFSASFHFDDRLYILNNRAIHQLAHISEIWNFNPPRFITFLSLALNYAFSGTHVLGYHITNFFIHVIASFFAFLLLQTLLQSPFFQTRKTFKEKEVFYTSLFAALIFATHPVQTQAVTYIWQRTASLAGMFSLISFFCYARASQAWHIGQNRKGRCLYFTIGALISMILAMLSKQNTVIIPFVFLLIEIFFYLNGKKISQKNPWLVYFFLAIPVLSFLSFSNQDRELRIIHDLGDRALTPIEYLLTQAHVMKTYLRLLILPIGQNFDYDFPISRSLGFANITGFLLIAALLTIGTLLYRKQRMISFGIFFFFTTLAIESSIIPLEDVIMEHRLYLPLFGFVAILSSLFFQVHAKFRNQWSQLAPFLLIIPLITTTFIRNQVYATEERLWLDVIQKSPQKSRGYNNLGVFYLEQNRKEKALHYFNKSIAINEKDFKSHFNLGLIHFEQGKLDQAKEHYQKALQLEPRDATTHYNLGGIYYQKRQDQKAHFHFKWAKQLGYPVPSHLLKTVH